MSWSFDAVGKPGPVLAKMKADTARSKCIEPEETIRNNAVALVEQALSAFPPDFPVTVKAGGSQSQVEGGSPNSLQITITPMHFFLV